MSTRLTRGMGSKPPPKQSRGDTMASTGLGAKGTFPQSVRSLGILRGDRGVESRYVGRARVPGCVGAVKHLQALFGPFERCQKPKKAAKETWARRNPGAPAGSPTGPAHSRRSSLKNKGRRDGRNQPRLIVSMVVVMLEREGIHLQRAMGGKALGALAWAPDGHRTGQRGLATGGSSQRHQTGRAEEGGEECATHGAPAPRLGKDWATREISSAFWIGGGSGMVWRSNNGGKRHTVPGWLATRGLGSRDLIGLV